MYGQRILGFPALLLAEGFPAFLLAEGPGFPALLLAEGSGYHGSITGLDLSVAGFPQCLVWLCIHRVFDFTSNGAWDEHIRKVLDNGRKKVNRLHSVISNRDINMSARRLLLLAVVKPTLEYGSEVWEANSLRQLHWSL